MNSIGGDLLIGVGYGWNANPQLENLTGLENLISVSGDLTIGGNIFMESLSGLNNLSAVGGSLSISNNPALSDISDLESLTSIGGELIIGIRSWKGNPMGNPLLASLTGLEGITSLSGFALIGNHALIDLNGLNNVQSVTGYVIIGGNNALSSLEGLEALTVIGGNLQIGYAGYYGWINNPLLYDLTGLEGLLEIGGFLEIGGSTLNNLVGLNNLESIGNDLIFLDNGYLANMEGFDNLDSVGGNMLCGPYPGTGGQVWTVAGNPVMQDFTGMEYLDYIGGDIVFSDNSSLSSLSGIENLTFIEGDLIIYENENLTNISGIENIDAGSIENLEIQYNDLLEDCEIQSICDYLANPNGTVEIHHNASGCDSQWQVEEECLVEVEEVGSQQSAVSSYPNPTQGILYFAFRIS